MTLEDRLEDVRREYLQRMTQGEGQLLRQVETYVTSRSGKMLRPRMLLAAAATQGEEVLASRRTLLLAVCMEMLHNASLLHDDVIDCADTRRGMPSVNKQWNNFVAVLVGDYLLAKIMQLLDEVDDRDVSQRINDTIMQMVEAELLAQEVESSISTFNFQLSTYQKIIDGKTARLFATAAALGNPAYEEFGLHYGRLFQLRDDVADGEATPFTGDLIRQEEETLRTIKCQLPIQI